MNDGPAYSAYRKQCSGSGSVLSFILAENTREAAYRVLDQVQIAQLAVSLGGTETLIEHPRSMTHSDIPPEDLDRSGISEGLIRLSVGLESSEDVIADLLHALNV